MDSLTLQINNLCKSFANREVLSNVTLSLQSNNVFIFTGNSGEGKTTFLRILAGIENYEGEIYVSQNETKIDFRKFIAYVPQQNSLWDNLTVIENITLYRELKLKETRETAKAKVENLLELLKITHLVNRYPARLSQGEQQRVAFARAIATDRSIYLMDEVSANLDLENKGIITSVIKKLSSENFLFVVVTHDLYFAQKLSSKYFKLQNGKISEFQF